MPSMENFDRLVNDVMLFFCIECYGGRVHAAYEVSSEDRHLRARRERGTSSVNSKRLAWNRTCR